MKWEDFVPTVPSDYYICSTREGRCSSWCDDIVWFCLHLASYVRNYGNYQWFVSSVSTQSQDILNAMHFDSIIKALTHKLMYDGWNAQIDRVTLFCEWNDIVIPGMNAH